MHRIYRSTQTLLAAQITAIAMAPVEEGAGSKGITDNTGLLLTVDTGEQFAVPAAWASSQGVQAGGYLGLLGQHEKGQAVFIPAPSFATSFEYLGDVPSAAPAAPEPDKAMSANSMAYDFDSFVQYAIDSGARIVCNGMPWSFTFHGRAVTHENDNCYLILGAPGKDLRFERGDTVIVQGDEVFVSKPAPTAEQDIAQAANTPAEA